MKYFVRVCVALFILLAFAATPYAAEKEKAMAENSNRAWIKRFYTEVPNNGNVDLIDKLVSKDYVEREPLPGFESNREGLKQFFKMMRTAFPDLSNNIEFMVVEDDKVAVYVTMTGTHKGEYMGIPATGKKFNIKVIDIIKIVDGKMVEHWGVGDYMTMMQQLGTIPQ